MNFSSKNNGGQSLIEVLIAVSIGALIVGSAAGSLLFTVRSNQQNRATDAASPLAQELLDNVRSIAEGRWRSIYDLTKTTSVTTYPYSLDDSLNIVAASQQKTVNNIVYTRYFTVEDVNRENCGRGNITTNAETFLLCSSLQTDVFKDPSTQKITVKVTWPQGGVTAEVLLSEYFTRSKNEINQFTDWSGSTGVVGGPDVRPGKDYFSQSGLDGTTVPGALQLLVPASSGWLISSTFDTAVTDGAAFNSLMWKGSGAVGSTVKFQLASSNSATGDTGGSPTGPIDSTDRYAWNDIIGWLDFYGAPGGPATVSTAKMTRWATSTDGDFALDCATTTNGDVCATSNFYVSNNNGNLAGWAWNDAYGWVSFCGNSTSGSTWDGSTWVCPASPTYQVTITQATAEFHGWAWNDIIGWISFNCAEPGVCLTSSYKVKVAGAGSGWNYIGPDGSPSSFYITTGPDSPVQIVTAHHNNRQYYRYKVYLESTAATPIVNDIIVNWSP